MASGVENKATIPRKTKAMGTTATGIVERIFDESRSVRAAVASWRLGD